MLAFEAVQLLDVSGPLQVFTSANETIAKAGGPPPGSRRCSPDAKRDLILWLRVLDELSVPHYTPRSTL
jgi:hypothetical protein